MNSDVLRRAEPLRLMAFDVDGIMTDGRLYLTESGEEMKAFHTLDGQGIKMLMNSGLEVAMLTARQSTIVERRARELGIRILRQGLSDKLAAMREIQAALGVSMAETGYAGDDLADLAVLCRCGFAATVPAAPVSIRSHAHYVTQAHGGRGAVRELCEVVLQAQGKLEQAISPFME